MSSAKLKSIWLQLPAWAAFILGLGALSAGNARAERSQLQPPKTTPESSSRALTPQLDKVALKIEGENIHILQHDGTFEELRLGDTQEAAHLRRLLRDAMSAGQPVSVPVGSIIVASGGGSGSGTKPRQRSSSGTTDQGKGK